MSDTVATITDANAAAMTAAADAPAVLGGDSDVVVIKAEAADGKKLPERAIEHEDGTIELPLFVPVVLRWKSTDSGTVTEEPAVTTVLFRRLTGKDVRVVMNAGAGDAFFNELTWASVRQQFPSKMMWLNTLDRMDGADSAGCIRIAQYFLENGPRTPGPIASRR